jgi:hypothetical protein
VKTKRKQRSEPLTAFWDASGIVPLCCRQARTTQARQTARIYGRQVVWWATSVEPISAFNRLLREGEMSEEENCQSLERLNYLRHRWSEIQPTEEVRNLAERLLGAHRLRAGDALQLAAALVWCSQNPRGRCFIGADGHLSHAAQAEGFSVIHLL